LSLHIHIPNRQSSTLKLSAGFARLLTSVLLIVLAVGMSGCKTATSSQLPQSQCRRVISLSPSITEVLYALQLGNNVVGVTQFCLYPADARRKPKVGGYVDPNMEAMLRLKPDLIVVRKEQTDLVQRVRDLRIPVLPVEHRNTEGILNSFEMLGQVCQRQPQAQSIVSDLRGRIQAIERKTQGVQHKPTVLVAVDRDTYAKKLRWVYVPGEDGFFNSMIRQAGGKNAAPAGRKGFLQVSSEGIIRMNPDIIIEALPYTRAARQNPEDIRKQWDSLPQVAAVRNHRVYLFTDDFMVIPGPRYVQALEKFAQVIHPELDWKHDQPPQRP